MTWAEPCDIVSSGICGQWRPRSACASAQSDQGLRCPLPESLDTIECIKETKDLDDTLRMRKMMWFRTFSACPKALFRLRLLKWYRVQFDMQSVGIPTVSADRLYWFLVQALPDIYVISLHIAIRLPSINVRFRYRGKERKQKKKKTHTRSGKIL